MRAWNLFGVAYLSIIVLSGCSTSSTIKVHVEESDFKVMEAAPGGRESWLDNPNSFAEEKGWDLNKVYYYTGEARSADKRMSCEKAQANVMDDVAKQVATFTDTSLARSSSDSSQTDTSLSTGQSNVSEETQRISSQLSKAQLNNVLVKKTYWERRDYSQGGGARNLHVCWVLATIGKQEVNNLIARAAALKIASNPELKEQIGKKLEGIDQKYEEWQKTH